MGANPIRARRRDANIEHKFLLNATIQEKSLEVILRRRIYVSLSRNIQILLSFARSCGRRRKGKK